MALTKERLVAALNVAKNAQAEIDAAKAGEAAAVAELATVTAQRDEYKVGNDIVNDPEVVALVDEIVPPTEPAPAALAPSTTPF